MTLDTIEAGREAARQHRWERALEALTEADRESGLSADDLMLLGDSLWWSAQPDKAEDAFQRAYNEYLGDGRITDAATVGLLLAYFALRRLATSVTSGWVSRVEKLLADEPESPAHAWLYLVRSAMALFIQNDLNSVVELTEQAIETAQRQGVVGVQALGLSFKGVALTYQGHWREGMALIDEASVLAISRGDDLRATSDVYCTTIGICSTLADYARAGEWTEQAERWMRSNAVGGFTGVCQVHRAELKRLKGAWSEAERVARDACVELERFGLLNGIGFAQYEIGEVRRRMGDLDAAEEAFARAYQYGHPAQPGWALLMMDRGDLEGATESIEGALAATTAGEGAPILIRGHLLPAQAEIAIAAGDMETAREALTELEELAETYEAASWRGMALTCKGSMELSEGHADAALDSLDKAWRIWQQVNLPYEEARARELLGRARLATANERAAALEFRSARAEYERLGAEEDLKRLAKLSGDTRSVPGERTEKTFMFTDIVTSTDLIDLIGDDSWQNLLDWHDRELRTVIEDKDGEVVRHTGDGFFAAFDAPRDAIDAAVSIQRRLVEHREEEGFAPNVRIGLHMTEATKHRGDYSGKGVHVAARIGDLGEKEEIVGSKDTLDAAGPIPYPMSTVGEVALKGVREPVTVGKVDWHS